MEVLFGSYCLEVLKIFPGPSYANVLHDPLTHYNYLRQHVYVITDPCKEGDNSTQGYSAGKEDPGSQGPGKPLLVARRQLASRPIACNAPIVVGVDYEVLMLMIK